jgi:hypothetical protein
MTTGVLDRQRALRQFVQDNPKADWGDAQWAFGAGNITNYWIYVAIEEVVTEPKDMLSEQESITALKFLVSLLDLPFPPDEE